MEPHALAKLVYAHKRGEAKGLASFCSAHPQVLQTIIKRGVSHGQLILIEATCNQVNQNGGYTGMTPIMFVNFVNNIAKHQGMAQDQLVFGGDHLGPSVWQEEPASSAMGKAEVMVRSYVNSGFSKIHLDASMHLCGDDPTHPLDVELIARRTAKLAKASEEAHAQHSNSPNIHYVIGTEVPTPGGALERQEKVKVTSRNDVRETIDATYTAFCHERLEAAWERVIAIVVQLGVEFGDGFIQEYDPAMTRELSKQIELYPNLVFEAHSTDYQSRKALQAMVRDHFAILKVGPALTNAFREMVFSLAMIENEMFTGSRSGIRSNIINVIEEAMIRSPDHWKRYYKGTPENQSLSRKYSLCDRIRYYWSDPRVQYSLRLLINNLETSQIPSTLLSQFAPLQYNHVRQGCLVNSPSELIIDRIDSILEDYENACNGQA